MKNQKQKIMFVEISDGNETAKVCLKDADVISDKELEACLPYLDEIIEFTERLKTKATEAAMLGKEWKGMTLEIGRTSRRWRRSHDALFTIGAWLVRHGREDLTMRVPEASLKTVEEEFGKEIIEEELGGCVYAYTGKAKLVPMKK